MLLLHSWRWLLKDPPVKISLYWKRSLPRTRRVLLLPGMHPVLGGLRGLGHVLGLGAAAGGQEGRGCHIRGNRIVTLYLREQTPEATRAHRVLSWSNCIQT